MFTVNTKDIEMILSDYGISTKVETMDEVLRYRYEERDPNSKEVRLILKVVLNDGRKLIIKLKHEEDTSAEIAEEQCRFSELLELNRIPTAHMLKRKNRFVSEYNMNHYEVFATVEEFKDGQVQAVDVSVAEKTGVMLAKSHNIAENMKYHVDYPVLFDPFDENDLFFVEEFRQAAKNLSGEGKKLYDDIMKEYERRMSFLTPLLKQPRYAVQGDISCENLFLTADHQIGVFDYNRCGDNNLYCDVIMQAFYEARLMNYPEQLTEDYESKILWAFLSGYNTKRAFTEEQKELFSHLYAIITTFWGMQILYNEDSFNNLCKKGDTDSIIKCLRKMKQQIHSMADMRIYEVQ